MNWQLLVLSLPTDNATARMRAWRALRACGAAVLRDGVYALPDNAAHQQPLQAIAADVLAHQGVARLMRVDQSDQDLRPLFDRSADFDDWRHEALALQARLPADHGLAQRETRKLRRRFERLVAIDFFAGDAQLQAQRALQALEAAVALAASPDEPRPASGGSGGLGLLALADHQGRCWATRCRPGVDRLASAWLIRRFIDPQARFVWLRQTGDCPSDALGYDFDGARFSHVEERVTFEVLLARFGLSSPALLRMGALVRALDAGGPLPPEAPGVESVLTGMRTALTDDEQLRLAAAGVFEGLLVAFNQDASS